jgi:hypothetical protein
MGSGSILARKIFEVQNGHFLRFQSEICFVFAKSLYELILNLYLYNSHIQLQNSILGLSILTFTTTHFTSTVELPILENGRP